MFFFNEGDNETNEKIEKFRDGIFALNTRRFGKVAELMIKEIYHLNDSENIAYDLLAKNKEKIEVKFSRGLRKCKETITEKNMIKQLIASNLDNRMLTFEMAKEEEFDCNIQQIKPKEFKTLYYGCFFADKIMVCKIGSSQIAKDKKLLYSDRQHRGNVGEGQFHINNTTLENHLNKYLVQWLTYGELYAFFE